MEIKNNWYLLENEADFELAKDRYEDIKTSVKGSKEHKEKMLLVHLMSEYENKLWDLPEVDPIEIIKIRMQDFGYNAATLAKEYGDKGTVSKVLNYKQSLSLSMIRKFSQLLKIPAEWLIKEYPLKKAV
ncbi:HTH-type transcriptional regulator / antitoxin HigA [Algoriphagus alkaliphilus]|uniref:HTH-type transcriptional regulator / antitoxin HigA n=1 Tax=Algoriphagus alkaliphilus TaxID=279824 RepID=A0A1G5YJD9_9BACT|nr:XRE family transcriptional regulator [Algoriphagus alkaliphilus]MBA4301781.1 XRE family transcriptional regulator [Cyclobacterium sp.]SDA82137.1 HTH-type transcriptional regulator / antitoxin HigA [Algoriphagus alkaliphilus]